MTCVPCRDNPAVAYLEVGTGTVKVEGCPGHLYLLAEHFTTGRRVQAAAIGFPRDPRFCCPRCGAWSASPWDAIFGYCGGCHAYTAAS